MTPDIEARYQRIAQELANVLPPDARQAWATAEVMDDVSGTEVFYRGQGNEVQHLYDGLDDLDDLDDLIFDLREHSRTAGGEVWSTITVALDGEGRFSIDFGCGDVSDLGEAGARRSRWIEPHIGDASTIRYA